MTHCRVVKEKMPKLLISASLNSDLLEMQFSVLDTGGSIENGLRHVTIAQMSTMVIITAVVHGNVSALD